MLELGWPPHENVARTAGSRTRVAVLSRGPGNTHCEVTYLSLAALPYAYACGCVLANADKRLTIINTYTHSTYQPIAHLQGQHPMTAIELCWVLTAVVMMTWCAEWKWARPPQPAGREEETKPGKGRMEQQRTTCDKN